MIGRSVEGDVRQRETETGYIHRESRSIETSKHDCCARRQSWKPDLEARHLI